MHATTGGTFGGLQGAQEESGKRKPSVEKGPND